MFQYLSEEVDCWKQVTWISPFCCKLPCERAQGRQQEAWATAQVPPFLKRVKRHSGRKLKVLQMWRLVRMLGMNCWSLICDLFVTEKSKIYAGVVFIFPHFISKIEWETPKRVGYYQIGHYQILLNVTYTYIYYDDLYHNTFGEW